MQIALSIGSTEMLSSFTVWYLIMLLEHLTSLQRGRKDESSGGYFGLFVFLMDCIKTVYTSRCAQKLPEK